MIGRGNIHSIKNYDAIGFDMDFTLVEYKHNIFNKLLWDYRK